jgi:hypothetical protein
MKLTNLAPYTIAALLAGALTPGCGSSDSGNGGTGGSGGSGGGSASGGSGDTGGSGGGKPFDSGSDPARNMVAPGKLCQRVAEIQCAGEQFCCSNPMRTKDACVAAQLMVCSQTLALDFAAMDPITGFDMTKSNAAFAQFETLASTCDTGISKFGIGTDGFRGIAAGTRDSGAACDADTKATNHVAAVAAALASCKDPGSTACLPAMGGWKCAALSASAGPCFTDANCKDDLYCENPLQVGMGTCTARKATGADCMLGNECSSFVCASDKCAATSKDAVYCLGN